MKASWISWFWAWALLSTLTGAANAVPVDGGEIRGAREGRVTVYKGVPFAAPPVGDLRWRPPQPVKPWQGLRHADAFAPACMQTGVSMPGETPPKTSEDCLYLNIWTAGEKDARLPVIVWIYGGGFNSGSAAMPLYWGDRLALKGVVVVTIAYRVGPFGFLSHPGLSAESPQRSSGNYGLMDQIAALEWVQRNIAAFGGDPRRVTIAGQSAGAMSVSILMASSRARGLFHRAIGQSGGFFEPVQIAPGYLLKHAEREGEAFAASLDAASVAALRALPAQAVLKGKMVSGSHPVIEPIVLPEPPFDVFAAGRQADVPLLLGANAEEARAMVDVKHVRAATFEADIAKTFGPLPADLLAPYPRASDEGAARSRIAFESDLRFRWDTWTWARLHAQAKRPVFFYRFAQTPPFPADSVRAGWGASHFAELWYVFDHLGQERWPWTSGDLALASAMSTYWVNFAKAGYPNGRGLVAWPAFVDASGPALRLAERIEVEPVADQERLRVFDGVYSQLRETPLP